MEQEVEWSVVCAAAGSVLVVAILMIAQQLELGEADCEAAFVADENDCEASSYQMQAQTELHALSVAVEQPVPSCSSSQSLGVPPPRFQ